MVTKKPSQASGMVQLGPELSAIEAEAGRGSEITGGYWLFQVKVPSSHSGRCPSCRLCLPSDPKMFFMAQCALILYNYQGVSIGTISLAGDVCVCVCLCR